MITYVNTVLVSNGTSADLLKKAPTALTTNTVSVEAGKFIIQMLDPADNAGATHNQSLEAPIAAAGNPLNADGTVNMFGVDLKTANKIRIGLVTKKNYAIVNPATGAVEYRPVVKWSNEIDRNAIKSYKYLKYANDTQDTVTLDFTNLNAGVLALLARGGKRVIVRLTYKDLPGRYRKWSESYEYVTKVGENKASLAKGIAAVIAKATSRARVTVNATVANKVILTAMEYDDDNSVDSISPAATVRFAANMYYTDPEAAGFASRNKYFVTGATITKVPGKIYAASAKLVRDHEYQAMGYEGVVNRGCCTYPIIRPEMQTNLAVKYDGIVMEFENQYRTADDWIKNTKQTVELYAPTGMLVKADAALNEFFGFKLTDGEYTKNDQ